MAGTIKLDGTTFLTKDSSNNFTLDVGSGGSISQGTIGSNVTFPTGMVVNTGAVQNSTRTTVSNSTSTDRELLAIGNYNKLYSSTDLIIHAFSPADNGNISGKVGIGLKYGSSSTQWGGYFAHTGNVHATILIAYLYLTGHTTTGSQSISLRSGAANSADATPCDFLNPNSIDDARNHQTITTAIVYEIQT